VGPWRRRDGCASACPPGIGRAAAIPGHPGPRRRGATPTPVFRRSSGAGPEKRASPALRASSARRSIHAFQAKRPGGCPGRSRDENRWTKASPPVDADRSKPSCFGPSLVVSVPRPPIPWRRCASGLDWRSVKTAHIFISLKGFRKKPPSLGPMDFATHLWLSCNKSARPAAVAQESERKKPFPAPIASATPVSGAANSCRSSTRRGCSRLSSSTAAPARC